MGSSRESAIPCSRRATFKVPRYVGDLCTLVIISRHPVALLGVFPHEARTCVVFILGILRFGWPLQTPQFLQRGPGRSVSGVGLLAPKTGHDRTHRTKTTWQSGRIPCMGAV